MNISN